MKMYGVCALLVSLATQPALAQESPADPSEPWTVDARIKLAARALLPPAPSQRRNIARHSSLSPALQDTLSQNAGSMERDALPVRIHLAPTKSDGGNANLEKLRGSIERLGGEVEATMNGVIYTSLPAQALAKLASMPGIRLIEPQATFAAQTMSGPYSKDAVREKEKLLATLTTLHDAGMRGKGVRVGILDFSFAGYSTLLATQEVPSTVAQRNFANKVTNTFENDLQSRPAIRLTAGREEAARKGTLGHGTECARIIHAFAPDAELVIASVGEGRDTTEGRVLAAAQWLAAQGARIINFSGSGYVSALDGSAPLDQLIDQLAEQGSTWIVAAGNQAQLHWQGRIADTNRDGWVDPTPGISPRPYGDLFAIEMARAGPATFTLNWGPWNGQPSDLDIFLYRAAEDGKLVQIAQSDSAQVGGKTGGTRPVEIIQTVLEPGVYFLGVRATRLLGKGTAHLFVSGAQRMMPVVESGSVGSPGTAKKAITVGAINVNGMTVEPYSGRGPTTDGRRKPELLASGEVFNVDGTPGFRGTSAAAPVVSGIAALMMGSGTQISELTLRERLQQSAQQSLSGVAGPTSSWGSLAPAFLIVSPRVPR